MGLAGSEALIVGIDGGASKTDVAAVTVAGELLGREIGPGSCPHYVGLDEAVRIVDGLVTRLVGGRPVRQVAACISGLDLPREVEAFRDEVARLPWGSAGLEVENDLFGLLRTGTGNANAIAVVCGTGTNAVGVHENGEKVRFFSLGALSGDWGGGQGLGQEALWHAARAVDGRGPQTALTDHIVGEYGLSVAELIERIHLEEIDELALSRLAPAVLTASDGGDAVARRLVDRQAEEIVAYVRACVTRLAFQGPVEIVLGGGILRTENAYLHRRIAEGIAGLLPQAHITTPGYPPVVGATLLAMEAAGASVEAMAALRAAFSQVDAIDRA